MKRRKYHKLYEISNPSPKETFTTAELSYPKCDLIAGADETRSVYIWKAGLDRPILTLNNHNSAVNTLLLNNAESELYSGLKGGMIVLWDLSYQKVKINLQGHSTLITAMSIYRKNDVPCALASASAEGKIKLWDLKSKSAATNFKGHFTQIDTLSFSPDFTYLASGAQDGIVKLWDIRMTNKSIKEIASQEQKSINCIEFNPGAIAFAYGSKDKVIRYWDLNKFNLIGATTKDRLPIQKLAFDNNGQNLFCATDEALKYWEINDHGMSLVDMYEIGWNKLQSFKYIEGRAICALSTFANKISYYLFKYKDLLKHQNPHLRANPDMGNISEVQENENSTFIENDLNLDLKTNNLVDKKLDKKSEKFDNYTNSVISNFENQNFKNNNNTTANAGISLFINDGSNINDLSNTSCSKIENESVFMRNALNMIGQNNYKGPKTPIKYTNHDDVPLPKPDKDYFEKDKKKSANKDDGRNLLGNISALNISDDESKGDLTMGSIFGNSMIKYNKDSNEKESTSKTTASNNNNEDDLKNFLENDLDCFFGNANDANKDFNLSVIQNSDEVDNFLDGPIFRDTKKSLAFSELLKEDEKFDNDLININEQKKHKVVEIDLTDDKNKKDELNLSKIDLNNINNISEITDTNNTNTSYLSLKSNETMGLDFNQFAKDMNETQTVDKVPISNDLPILEEIESQHNNMRKSIQKRYNALKMVGKSWNESNIPSTVNSLNLIKDITVTKDFFNYAIINRRDINKLPFSLDSASEILPNVKKLMKSKYDIYWKLACKVGIVFLKIYMERIVMAKQGYKNLSPLEQTDPIIEERNKKCDEIISIFKEIYQMRSLKLHCVKAKQEGKNEEDVANAFYTDLEFFLKPFGDDKIVIRNVN